MHIEHSSISCGIRRLVIKNEDGPNKEQLAGLLNANRNSCAILVTGIPSQRKDIKALLIASGFEQVKDGPKQKPIIDPSVKTKFADLATLLMYHDHDMDDLDTFEHYVGVTINNDLTETATMIMHHGEFVGNTDFFIYYMSKNKD